MSFGFSPSDVYGVIAIAVKAYRGWNSACGEYSDITLSLSEIKILLERIRDESEDDGSVLVQSRRDADQLKGILAGVGKTSAELDRIIEHFKSLGNDRSRERNWSRLQRNWDRLRLENTNLNGVRLKLTQHVTAITAYLETVGLSSLARVEQSLHALPERMQATMNTLAAEIRAGRREGSIMTAYEGDDSHVWREFRRELIGEGFRGSEIHKYKPRIKQCLQQWKEEGLLEEQQSRSEAANEAASKDDHLTSLDNLAKDESGHQNLAESVEAGEASEREVNHVQASLAEMRVETTERTAARSPNINFNGATAYSIQNCEVESTDAVNRDEGATEVQPKVQSNEQHTGHSESENDLPKPMPSNVVQADNHEWWKLRLNGVVTVSDKSPHCTVIIVVPDGELRLFSEFALYPRTFLPSLFSHLPRNAVFRSLVVMDGDSKLPTFPSFNTLTQPQSGSRRFLTIGQAEGFLRFDRRLFDSSIQTWRKPQYLQVVDFRVNLDWLLEGYRNVWHHSQSDYSRTTSKGPAVRKLKSGFWIHDTTINIRHFRERSCFYMLRQGI